MKTEKITNRTITEFQTFCRKHRTVLDDSYLSDHELQQFSPDSEPAYIIRNEDDVIIGAISIMLNEDYNHANKARFRIFYCETNEMSAYQTLFELIQNHIQTGDYLYAFVKEEQTLLQKALQHAGFGIERYVFVLERDHLTIEPSSFPDDYSLKTFSFGQDEDVFCQVRNAGFKQLLGFTPMSPETAANMKEWDDYLGGGVFLLYHKSEPIGVVRTGKDFYNNHHYATVNTLAIIPEYQGKGLGRQLLRSSVRYGNEKGLEKGFLCVNADNAQASKLYEQEGFYKTESFICFNFTKN